VDRSTLHISCGFEDEPIDSRCEIILENEIDICQYIDVEVAYAPNIIDGINFDAISCYGSGNGDYTITLNSPSNTSIQSRI
jgi:hypothetical protein